MAGVGFSVHEVASVNGVLPKVFPKGGSLSTLRIVSHTHRLPFYLSHTYTRILIHTCIHTVQSGQVLWILPHYCTYSKLPLLTHTHITSLLERQHPPTPTHTNPNPWVRVWPNPSRAGTLGVAKSLLLSALEASAAPPDVDWAASLSVSRQVQPGHCQTPGGGRDGSVTDSSWARSLNRAM